MEDKALRRTIDMYSLEIAEALSDNEHSVKGLRALVNKLKLNEESKDDITAFALAKKILEYVKNEL